MEVKAGYKQTDVGVIPEDWKAAKIEDLAYYITVGFVGSMSYLFVNEGVPLLRGQNILPHLLNLTNLKYISPETHCQWKKSSLIQGDIAIVRVGYPGTACVIPEGIGELNAASLVIVRPNHKLLDSDFLCYILNSPWGKDQIRLRLVGGAQQVVNTRTAADLKVPVPPLPEQRAIATAISDVDALITSLDQIIAKKRDIKQAAMQELLTGKRRLPGFETGEEYSQTEIGPIPEDWDVDSIGKLSSITTGDKNTQDRIEDGIYPFFVRSSTVEKINSYSFDGEAVLTAGDGVGTGKIFHYIKGKFDFHQRVYKISNFCERIDGYFFYLYFSNHFYSRIMQMTAKSSVDSVRRDMISNMNVPFPTIPEQRAIATILADMDVELAALEQKRGKTKAIKQGMMQELLTGRIRLT